MRGTNEMLEAMDGVEEERLRRCREHWDGTPLSQRELSRLRLRLLRDASSPARQQAGRWALGLGLGGVLAAGTTLAALGAIPWLGVPAEPLEVAAPANTLKVQAREPRAEVAPSYEKDREVTPEPPVDELPPSQRRLAPRPEAAAASWADARDALRREDLPHAEQVLRDLSRSGDSFSRDSAALSLAELHTKQRRPEKAHPILTRLARDGHTAHIRERAEALLQR